MKQINAPSHTNTHMHRVKLGFMAKTGSHYVSVAGFELVLQAFTHTLHSVRCYLPIKKNTVVLFARKWLQ